MAIVRIEIIERERRLCNLKIFFDLLPAGDISPTIVVGFQLKSEFNDVITEFLVIKDETMYALAFDPDAEKWHQLESREFTQKTVHEVEDELIDRLYDWREVHVKPFLIEKDLIPNVEI